MDAAYAAGILDGEGCLTIGFDKRKTTYGARIYIGMTAKALSILHQFEATYGGSLKRHRKSSARWDAAWMWTISGKGCVRLLLDAQPHLVLKRQQASCLLELEAMKPDRRNLWTTEMRLAALCLKLTVMELNRKGPDVPLGEIPPEFQGWEYVRVVDGLMLAPKAPDLYDNARWMLWQGRFGNSAISVPGGFVTANTSEFPNDGTAYSACSLADVLEPDAPPKYWLSPKAATGILRRAAKRNKPLPPRLEAALTALASRPPVEAAKTTKTSSSGRSRRTRKNTATP